MLHYTYDDDTLDSLKGSCREKILPRGDVAWTRRSVFFYKQCGAVNVGGTLRLLKSLCDGTGESQNARRKLERWFDAE